MDEIETRGGRRGLGDPSGFLVEFRDPLRLFGRDDALGGGAGEEGREKRGVWHLGVSDGGRGGNGTRSSSVTGTRAT